MSFKQLFVLVLVLILGTNFLATMEETTEDNNSDPSNHRMKVGEKFSSWEEFVEARKHFETITKSLYTVSGNQRTIDNKNCTVRSTANRACKYHWVTMSCKQGEKKEESRASVRTAK